MATAYFRKLGDQFHQNRLYDKLTECRKYSNNYDLFLEIIKDKTDPRSADLRSYDPRFGEYAMRLVEMVRDSKACAREVLIDDKSELNHQNKSIVELIDSQYQEIERSKHPLIISARKVRDRWRKNI